MTKEIFNALPRKEREKIKYEAVRNLTYDSKLARQARSFSFETLIEQYGTNILDYKKKGLKAVPRTPEELEKSRLPLHKFNYAKSKGVSPLEAMEYMRMDYKSIDEYIRFERPKRLASKYEQGRKIPTKEDRLNKWKYFSSNKNDMPPALEERAKRLNTSKGLNENDSYGFIVIFYAYSENSSIAKWANIINADKAGVNYYVNMVRSIRKR